MLFLTVASAYFQTEVAHKKAHRHDLAEQLIAATPSRLYLPLNGTFLPQEVICEFRIPNPSGNCTGSRTMVPEDGRESWLDYVARMSVMSYWSLTIRMHYVMVVMDYLIAASAWVGVGLNFFALWYWGSLKLSRSLLMIGWLMVFMSPFVISLVPMRQFIQWDGVDMISDGMMDEFREYFFAQKSKDVTAMCKSLKATQVPWNKMERTLLDEVGSRFGYGLGENGDCTQVNSTGGAGIGCEYPPFPSSRTLNQQDFATTAEYDAAKVWEGSGAIERFLFLDRAPPNRPGDDSARRRRQSWNTVSACGQFGFKTCSWQKTYTYQPERQYYTAYVDPTNHSKGISSRGYMNAEILVKSGDRTLQQASSTSGFYPRLPQGWGNRTASYSGRRRWVSGYPASRVDFNFTAVHISAGRIRNLVREGRYRTAMEDVSSKCDDILNKKGLSNWFGIVGTACNNLLDAGVATLNELAATSREAAGRKTTFSDGTNPNVLAPSVNDCDDEGTKYPAYESVTAGEGGNGDVAHAFRPYCASYQIKYPHVPDANRRRTQVLAVSRSNTTFDSDGHTTTIDFRQVLKYAGIIRKELLSPSYQPMWDETIKQCGMVNQNVSSILGGRVNSMFGFVDDAIVKGKIAAEMTSGLLNALVSFKVMLPSALTIAPGLIQAALTAKAMVPQSSIPGMFVVILPWLYCPLVWCIYNIVLQMIGNPYLLTGLVILAYSPMCYCFVGTMTAISRPMDEDHAVQSISCIKNSVYVMTFAAVCCLIGGSINLGHEMLDRVRKNGNKDTDISGLMLQEFKGLFNALTVCSILVSSMAKYLYTAVASVDYILEEIIAQREFEVVGNLDNSAALSAGLTASEIKKINKGFTKDKKLEDKRLYLLDVLSALAHIDAAPGVLERASKHKECEKVGAFDDGAMEARI